MDDLNRAYQVLGVNASMSIEEIEAVYDELVLTYKKEAKYNMYYQQKLEEWEEAYECILEERLDELDDESIEQIYPSLSHSSHHLVKEIRVGILVGFVVLMILGIVIVDQIYSMQPTEQQDELALNLPDANSQISQLANQFVLTLGKFNAYDQWDWGYYENGSEWTVVVVFEVKEAQELGALVNLYNFRLESDAPLSALPEEVYLDSEINHIHYLGQYSEIIPQSQKFGVVFKVDAFYEGEERYIYYHHPDGEVQTVGSLIFESGDEEVENPVIYVEGIMRGEVDVIDTKVIG